jgi:hypothetical protein
LGESGAVGALLGTAESSGAADPRQRVDRLDVAMSRRVALAISPPGQVLVGDRDRDEHRSGDRGRDLLAELLRAGRELELVDDRLRDRRGVGEVGVGRIRSNT